MHEAQNGIGFWAVRLEQHGLLGLCKSFIEPAKLYVDVGQLPISPRVRGAVLEQFVCCRSSCLQIFVPQMVYVHLPNAVIVGPLVDSRVRCRVAACRPSTSASSWTTA